MKHYRDPQRVGFKVCFACKQRKHVSEYYPHPTARDGLRARCKACYMKQVMENEKRRVREDARLAREHLDEALK